MMQKERDEMDLTAERLAAFLTGYASLLGEMRADELAMLAAVAGGDVAAMERGINLGQAQQKQLAQYEAQRQAMQRDAGGGDITLRQMAERMPENGRGPLLELIARVEDEARQLQVVNRKGMATAQANLAAVEAPVGQYASDAKKTGEAPRLTLETKA